MENVFVYFADFKRRAKQAGWAQQRINAVLDDAMSSDYEHALEIISSAILEMQEEKEPIKF